MTAPEACPVRWCQEPDGHDTIHRRYMVEVLARRGSIALTVEAADDRGRNRLPVLTAGNGAYTEVVLHWAELEQLARGMAAARKRYGS